MGLEPEVVPVSVNDKGSEAASREALFVYPMARELVSEHNMQWSSAIALAEKLWAKVPAKVGKRMPAIEDGPSDEEAMVLESAR